MPPSVYVGRLPPDVQKADVEDHFKPYGRVVDVRLMSNFGFVEFENGDEVDAAARALDGKEFMGERLIVERSRESRKRDFYDGGARPPPRVPRGRGVRVNIIGISSSTSWQDLKDFGRQGNETVTYADVDRETGNGVIEFPTMADAEDAIRRLDGSEIQGVPVKLEIATAPPGGYDRPPPRDFGRPRYDDRRGGGGGRYDDRPPRYDDRRGGGGYDDRPRYDDRPPRSDRYDDRPPRQDRYDDRRGGYGRDRSPPRRERDYPPRDREPREPRESREPREPREPIREERDYPPRGEERDYPPREERDFAPRD